MNPKKKKNAYTPPLVFGTTAVPLEAMLLAESALIDRVFEIEGQSIDGYFEETDLDSGWDWD